MGIIAMTEGAEGWNTPLSGLDPAGTQRGEERTPKPPHTHSQLPGEVGSQSTSWLHWVVWGWMG